ncbi:hypothetical protein Noda2021_03930 [Candidatus Dependentiae bacterium Noda2021]|nr:hypothetical protein Noda2021_03930 [Candidatus Dependentiae bacterium Noda2021]
MKLLVLVMSGLLISVPSYTNEEIVTIGGITRRINTSTSCSIDQWGNSAENSCQCCIISYKNSPEGKNKSGAETLQHCTTKGLCSTQTLNSLRQKINMVGSSDNDFVTALFNRAIVIDRINFDQTKLLNGNFTEQSLPLFLVQAYNEGKLPYKEFSNINCLTAQNLYKGGGESGFQTSQLFLLTSTCNPTAPASRFIIKGIAKGMEEAYRLEKLRNYPGIQELISPNVVPGFPSLSIPLAYFVYPYGNSVNYISKMPLAPGKQFIDYIEKYKANQTPANKEQLARAFQIMGMQLANFQKKFMQPVPGKILGKTLAHADLHWLNIFYDDMQGHFTLIDNETMEGSLQNRSEAYVDIVQFFFFPQLGGLFEKWLQGLNQNAFYEMAASNFALGYISVYPANQRLALLKELKDILNNYNSAAHVSWTSEKLKPLRVYGINPALDKLINQYQIQR